METPNILFLDMDGVLCTYRSVKLSDPVKNRFNGQDLTTLDRDALKFIKNIVELFKMKIVMTSSWRFNNNFREEYMYRHGFTEEHFHVDWRTKHLDMKRGDEIDDWLKRNGYHMYHPEHGDMYQHNYVIFDDEDFDLHEHQKRNNLVLCDPLNGIMAAQIEKFYEISMGFKQ